MIVLILEMSLLDVCLRKSYHPHLELFSCLQMDGLNFKKMDFSEFCAAAISVHHLEATDRWDQRARAAYDIFEKEGNRVINYDELAKVRPCLTLV